MIQIDEPAIREGLPLRRPNGPSIEMGRRCLPPDGLGRGRPDANPHAHVLFGVRTDHRVDRALDADVISIEAARSDMELLDAFARFKYPAEIGPGVYDIHTPRVPEVEEIIGRLRKALQRLRPDQLWVNPDCGLKTRGWPEVQASLRNMVEAAKSVRRGLGGNG